MPSIHEMFPGSVTKCQSFSWNAGGSLCPLFSTLPLDTKFLTFQVCLSFLCLHRLECRLPQGALSNLLKWIQLSMACWTEYAWSLQERITDFNSTGHNWIQNEGLTIVSFSCHLSLLLGSEACVKAAVHMWSESRSEVWPRFNYTVKPWNLTFMSLSCLYNVDRLFIDLILIIVLNQQV